MDIFEKEKKKKVIPIKNTWYYQLINNIPESVIKTVEASKDQVFSSYRRITLEETVLRRQQRKQKFKKLFISGQLETF